MLSKDVNGVEPFPRRAVAWHYKPHISISASDTLPFEVMKAIEQVPEQSQRALFERSGVSLGLVKYCLRAKNFKNAKNNLASD